MALTLPDILLQLIILYLYCTIPYIASMYILVLLCLLCSSLSHVNVLSLHSVLFCVLEFFLIFHLFNILLHCGSSASQFHPSVYLYTVGMAIKG